MSTTTTPASGTRRSVKVLPVRTLIRHMIKEHELAEKFYRNSPSDAWNINRALMVMHADTANSWKKALGLSPKHTKKGRK